MNNIIATILLIFVCLLSTQAQDSLTQYRRWSIGAKGGATFSFITATDEDITRNRLRTSILQGITYGGVIRYMTEKNFGLQVEANYTEKGWEEAFLNFVTGRRDPTLYYRVNLDYLEIPLMAYGYFGKRNVQIFLNIGMYGALLLSHQTEKAPALEEERITHQYIANEQNTFDLGLRGGSGMAVVTKVGTFQAEGTYSWGLNSILDRNRTAIPSILQNSTIAVTLGYLVQF